MRRASFLVPLIALACGSMVERPKVGSDDAQVDVTANNLEQAPPASDRIEAGDAEDLGPRIDSYFAGQATRRGYVQVDKPMYQPGETVWFRVWNLKKRDLSATAAAGVVRVEFVNPKGAVAARKMLQAPDGFATNDIVIPNEAKGGLYKLRIVAPHLTVERAVVVSRYEPPRIKKKLELVRKAYGAGDEVTATISIKRPTGEPLAKHPLRSVVWLDGESITPKAVTTDAAGNALIRFQLPKKIERGDATLTVMVEDGGVTESVSKRVPIVLKKLDVAMFPEGGQLVVGLPSRVYLEAKTMIGKPADVEGRIVDDHGQTVAKLRTHHFGLGRFAFTPSTKRRYHLEVSKPVGVTEKYPLPLAEEKGCVLRTFDDLDGDAKAIRAAVRCSSERDVVVSATIRDRFVDRAAVHVPSDAAAVVYLMNEDQSINRAQGVARVTVFDEAMVPLAERVVFRNRQGGMRVSIRADEKQYSPREQVALTFKTTDQDGLPVAADLAVSVVNDTVVSFADDKTAHLVAALLLSAELPGKIEEPKFFFDDDEPKAPLALELLMGTRGWRKFEWRPVLAKVVTESTTTLDTIGEAGKKTGDEEAVFKPRGAEMARPAVRPRPKLKRPKKVAAVAAPEPVVRPAEKAEAAPEPEPEVIVEVPRADAAARGPVGRIAGLAERKRARRRLVAPGDVAADELFDDNFAGRAKNIGYAPVRVFPAPVYTGKFNGVRTDFRETILWAPRVQTDTKGKATVTFYLSDAVTSFRVFAEGFGGGQVGREEMVFKSSLPFSMQAKLPLEVSAGDRISIPLTLTNDRAEDLAIVMKPRFGSLVKAVDDSNEVRQTVKANSRDSRFFDVRVGNAKGQTEVAFSATAGGLSDEFVRQLNVVPLGFPQSIARSGTLADQHRIRVDTGAALEGTLEAKLTLYGSPVSTLLSGIEGMLREPHGCFEQTSSSNYPNVMIMQYLDENDVADPALVKRVRDLMDRGYKKLAGFEASSKGYEWFGRSPAHEALTAYGVLEFADMRSVYGGVDSKMIDRTAAWLKSRRDGKGGYLRDGKALDTFGRADADLTNAYITYALTRAGHRGLDVELAVLERSAATSDDPYLVALATNALLHSKAHAGKARIGLARLAKFQEKNGSFMGKRHSITRSTGQNLRVETTALAVMALVQANKRDDVVRAATEWLFKARQGHGSFGATQATVLALQALTAYAKASRATSAPGAVKVEINGRIVAERRYVAGEKDPIVFEQLGRHLEAGANDIRLIHDGQSALPFAFAADFRTAKPANHPDTVVALGTKIEKTKLKMGANVRLDVTVTNKTATGQPMTMARVGLPGGLAFQTWQLKELKEKGTIAFYETRAREVILYFSDLKPSEVKNVPLVLVANVPGTYTGPASNAYLYYTDDQKVWTDPIAVQITP